MTIFRVHVYTLTLLFFLASLASFGLVIAEFTDHVLLQYPCNPSHPESPRQADYHHGDGPSLARRI